MLITLSSDIGYQDYLIGAIKGQIFSTIPDARIADISNALPQTNYPLAAYICSEAFKYYPALTAHIVLLNFYQKRLPRLLLAEWNNQFIVCPDNGFLTMITKKQPSYILAIPTPADASLLSYTAFLMPYLQRLEQTKTITVLGEKIMDIDDRSNIQPTIGLDWMEGQILYIDNFDNVIINITKTQFEAERKGRKFKIYFNRNEYIQQISEHYAAVPEGEYLAWFNAADYLELAINKGYLASLFGLQKYNPQVPAQLAASNKWFYQTVRIFFE